VQPDQCPRRNPDTAFRVVDEDGGLVVLSARSEVKVLNPVAIRVFALLDGEHTVQAITDRIVEEFEVDASEAARDVRDFLAELAQHGMLAADDTAAVSGTAS